MAVRGHGNREVMRQRDAVVLPTGEKIQFTWMMKYLGVMVHRSLDSVDSVKARVTAADGALSKPLLKASQVSSYVKGKIYERMVISTLLYGSESWALTGEAWVALRNFHNTKVRQMNGMTHWHSRSFRSEMQTCGQDLGSRVSKLQWHTGRYSGAAMSRG